MICTRSHLVCCEGCMFFLLVLAPGTFRRESSTSLLGTQPLCPRRPSSAKERRHSPGAMSRNEQRPPASLRPPHGERNQPHLWLLGNSSAWGQLASPLTGGSGRVICEGKSEKGVLGGLTIFWSVCVCVRACTRMDACTYVWGQGERMSETQFSAASTKPADKRDSIGRPRSAPSTPGLLHTTLHTDALSSSSSEAGRGEGGRVVGQRVPRRDSRRRRLYFRGFSGVDGRCS